MLGGHGKSDPLPSSAFGCDRYGNANQPPRGVEKGSARTAGIQRCIGLDVVLVAVQLDLGAAHGRYDTVGDGLPDFHRIADSEGEISGPNLI